MRSFTEEMGRFAGTPVADAALAASIALFNENRRLLRELFASRRAGNAALTSAQLQAPVKSSMVMDKQEHTGLPRQLLAGTAGLTVPRDDRVRLHLSGHLCHAPRPELLAAIEECGALAVDADGWLHMGDVGEMDERGYLKITGRIKDMIIRVGLNLCPAEIEGAPTDHPAIEAPAVIGIPDEVWGEQAAAVLRIRPSHRRPSVDELRAFPRGALAAHKPPVFWAFRDELPTTPSGKIQKFLLREEVAKGLPTFDEVRPTGTPDRGAHSG